MRANDLRRHAFAALVALALTVAPRGAAPSVILGGDLGKVSLGTGYDPAAQRMLDRCVEGTVTAMGGSVAWVTSSYTSDLETMRRKIDLYGSGGVDVGILGASKSIEYLARTAKTELREGIMLEYQAQLGSFVLSPNVTLNHEGQRVAAMTDPYARRLRCGTEFVQQVDVGYRLWISLTATFRSRQLREHYKERHITKALFGLIKKSSESVREIKKFQQNVIIEVSALQEGGRQELLDRILQERTICKGSEVEHCAELFARLLDYASSDTKGLRAQMSHADVYDPTDPDGPTVLRYVTSTYEDAGIEDMQTAKAPKGDLEALRDAKGRLVATLARLSSDSQRATALLESGELFQGQRARLRSLKQELSQLRVRVHAMLEACSTGETAADCAERAAEYEQAERAIDRSGFE